MRRTLGFCVALLTPAAFCFAEPPDTVSFRTDIAPLLKTRCAVCHLTGEEAGGMALHPRAAYASLVGVASIESPLLRIKPGAPDESYLVKKLEGKQGEVGGKGARMPLEGAPLAAEEISRIRAWISAGAPNN